MSNHICIGILPRGQRRIYRSAVELAQKHCGAIPLNIPQSELTPPQLVMRSTPKGIHVLLDVNAIAQIRPYAKKDLVDTIRWERNHWAAWTTKQIFAHHIILSKCVPPPKINRLAKDLVAGKSIIIQGVWGIGKTTLLAHLQRTFPLSVFTVYLPAIPYKPSDEEGAWNEFLEVLRKNIQVRFSLSSKPSDPLVLLNNLYGDQKGLLIIDEVTIYSQFPNILKRIAKIPADYPNIQLVVAGHLIFGSDLAEKFSGFAYHRLQQLPFKLSTKIIDKHLEGIGIVLTIGAKKRLHRISGGRAPELANLLSRLLDSRLDEYLPGYKHLLKDIYTAEDVNNLLKEIEDAIKQDIHADATFFTRDNTLRERLAFMPRIVGGLRIPFTHYAQMCLYATNDQGRMLLAALATNDLPRDDVHRDYNEELIKALIEATFISYNHRQKTYNINGELLRLFLRFVL